MKMRLFAAALLAASGSLPAAFAQDSFGDGQQAGQQPQTYPQQQQQQGYPQQTYPQQQQTYPQQQQQQQQQQVFPQQTYPQQQQQSYPQQQGFPQQWYPQQQQVPQQQTQPQQGGADLDRLMQVERQDFGVAPTSNLHAGAMHGPTPASIPGGQVVTTKGVVSLVQGKQAPYFLFDVLGGPETLPGAMPAAWLAQPGSFNDQVQQQFSQMLQQGTQGRKDMPLIFYCLSNQCWMSYNAALRAINAGYTNVLWYRGGIEAWKSAGLPVQPAQQGYPQQQGAPQQQYPQQQGGYPNQ